MEEIIDRIKQFSNTQAYALSGALIVLLIVLCWLTGATPALLALFVLPVIIVTVVVNTQAGIVFSILGTLAWVLISLFANTSETPLWIILVNGILMLILFSGIVYLLGEYKKVLQRERAYTHEDLLTGLPNLRGFFELAEREITRAKRKIAPISVAYLGLDNLEEVAKKHGKKTTDAILRKLAHSLVSNTRGTDVTARISDTDFILLMAETGIEGGLKGIRRVNDLLEETIEEYEMPVSFSIGLVTYNILPDNIQQMIDEANALSNRPHSPGEDSIHSQVVDL